MDLKPRTPKFGRGYATGYNATTPNSFCKLLGVVWGQSRNSDLPSEDQTTSTVNPKFNFCEMSSTCLFFLSVEEFEEKQKGF